MAPSTIPIFARQQCQETDSAVRKSKGLRRTVTLGSEWIMRGDQHNPTSVGEFFTVINDVETSCSFPSEHGIKDLDSRWCQFILWNKNVIYVDAEMSGKHIHTYLHITHCYG